MSGGEQGGRLTFIGHLAELRDRILISFVSVAALAIIAWVFRRTLFDFVSAPFYRVIENHGLTDVNLNAQGLVMPFVIDVKLCLFMSLIPSSVIILSQAWLFLRPGLRPTERRIVGPMIPLIFFLFLSGVTLGYFVFLPAAVNFLVTYGDQKIARLLSIDDYMNFAIILTAGCGLIFQLPIVTYFLSLAGILTPQIMLKHWRWAVVIIFFLAAIITPTPDPFNMSLMATPMLILYFISVGISRIVQNRKIAAKKE